MKGTTTKNETGYGKKLRDPRWQKKRLEIFQRDGFRCTRCQNGRETLHVHHKAYHKGKSPWEYDNQMLETLCESCHTIEHLSPEGRSEEDVALFKDYLLSTVSEAFDASRSETKFLPYGTFIDAVMDLADIQIFYKCSDGTSPFDFPGARERLESVINYLTERVKE